MNGRNCSIEDLYKALRGRLKAFASARIKDEALAEDIVQDAFVKLAHYCAGGGSCDYPKSLIFKVTENLVADHFRGRPQGTEQLQPEQEELPQPEEKNLNKEFIECFLPLIDELPPPYREALRLADIEQMPHKDIAIRMGISLSGVKSRVQRGRTTLKAMLGRLCRIERDHLGNIVECTRR